MNSPVVLHVQKVTGIGGTENMFPRLGRGLDERGWDCRFGLLHEPGNPMRDYAGRLEENGWRVGSIKIDRNFSPSTIARLREWMWRVEPAVLHTHLIHADLHGLLSSWGLDLHRVTTKHNDDAFKRRFGFRFFSTLLNRGFEHGVVISEHLKRFYERDLGVSRPRFARIYYGLDPEQYAPDNIEPTDPGVPPGHFCFGIVGRLVPQKGHSDLLEAFERVHQQDGATHLVIVGSGPLRSDLEGWVRDRDLKDAVTLTGFRSDVPALMKRFDVFVHPSRWEGFGLVFLEAMACRLPVIATRVSAIPEIVRDGKTGLLISPNDPDELHRAMLRMIESPGKARSMGERGYQRLRDQFSVERMVQQHDTLYRGLIRADQPPAE